MKRSLWPWLAALVWMGLIFMASAQPDLPSPDTPGSPLDTVMKKAGHVLSYGILACLYHRALGQALRVSTTLRILCVGLAMAYGLTDEFHQTFVPGRHGQLVDVAIDGVGASLAMLLTWWLERRRTRSRQTAEA